MKKTLVIGTILMMNLLITSYSFAQEKEVISKITKVYSAGATIKYFEGIPQEITYYMDGKEVAKETRDKKGNRIEIIGRIPNGLVKEYYKSGKLRCEANYKNGVLEGVCKSYSKSGQLQGLFNYKKGKLDGGSECYGDDEKSKQIFYYEDGNLKVRKDYYNGQLCQRWDYKDESRKDRSFCNYYESGRVKSRGSYKNDKLEGILYEYYDKGDEYNFLPPSFLKFFSVKLKSERDVKDDKLNGLSKFYHENGYIWVESNWKNGKQNGITKIYWEDSTIIAYIDTYKNGEKINRKAYNKYGKLLMDQDYPYTLDKKNK